MVALAACAPAQDSGRVYREGNYWYEDVTGTLTNVQSLRLKTDGGNVTVDGGSSGNITYTARKRVRAGSEEDARRYFAYMRITANSGGGAAVLSADSEGRGSRGSVDFIVNAPRSLQVVRATTGGGNIHVAHLNGAVKADSGGGNMDFDDLGAGVNASTGGGNVNIGNIGQEVRISTGGGNVNVLTAGGYLSIETGGGNVEVQTAKNDAKIETGGGSIRVAKVSGNLKAETGGNSIDIGDVGGSIDVETGGGSIRLRGGNGFVKAETGGGNISCSNVLHGVHASTGAGGITAEIRAGRGQFAESRLDTGAGDIIVTLPSDLAVTIRASIDAAMSKSAMMVTDFGDAIHVSGDSEGPWGPHELFAEGNLNGGGPVLKVHTSTGKIKFVRLQK